MVTRRQGREWALQLLVQFKHIQTGLVEVFVTLCQNTLHNVLPSCR